MLCCQYDACSTPDSSGFEGPSSRDDTTQKPARKGIHSRSRPSRWGEEVFRRSKASQGQLLIVDGHAMTKLTRKADAQNTALVKCIADNAISWIYSPVNQDEIEVSMDDVDGDEEEQAPRTSDPITSPLNEDEILIEEPTSSHSTVDTINGIENKDEEDSQDISSPAQCIGFSMGDGFKASSVISDGSPLDVEKDEVISCSQGSDMAYTQRHHTLELDDGEDSTPGSLPAAAIRTIEGHGKLLPHECTGSSYPRSWWCCDAGSDNWVDLWERLGAIFAGAEAKHKRIFDVFRANPTADTSSQVSDREFEVLANRLV